MAQCPLSYQPMARGPVTVECVAPAALGAPARLSVTSATVLCFHCGRPNVPLVLPANGDPDGVLIMKAHSTPRK